MWYAVYVVFREGKERGGYMTFPCMASKSMEMRHDSREIGVVRDISAHKIIKNDRYRRTMGNTENSRY